MPLKITPVDGNLAELLNRTFTGPHRRGWIKVDGCIMPEYYAQFADAIENFEVYDDDVWVSSFPKTGTTWTQEMVWCCANDKDSESAKLTLPERFPFLELSSLYKPFEALQREPNKKIPEAVIDSVNYVAKAPRPRFIKTHLPFHLLPRQIRSGEKNPKIVHVVRNPKDTCISFYHHTLLLEGFLGNFEDFVELFLGDTLHFAPFWDNVLGYWEKRTQDNVLFIKYEDMKEDSPSVIRRVAGFLGKSLTSEQVSALNEHLSFSKLKKNPAVNNSQLVASVQELTLLKRDGVFMRKGTTGQWKTDMTSETIQRFDDWIRKKSEGTGLSF